MKLKTDGFSLFFSLLLWSYNSGLVILENAHNVTIGKFKMLCWPCLFYCSCVAVA
jgi:hypothetical protein